MSWLFVGEPTLMARYRGKAKRLTYDQWRAYSGDIFGGHSEFTKFLCNISYPMHRLVTIGLPQVNEGEFNKR